MFGGLGVIILVAIVSVSAKNEVYKGHKVYNVKIETKAQQDGFHQLQSDMVDYWRFPSRERGVIGRAMVPPSHFDWFERTLKELEMDVDVHIEDVYEYLIEKEENPISSRDEASTSYDFTRYMRYDEILNYVNSLVETYSNSTTVSINLVQFGYTVENRALYYLKINSVNTVSTKPVVVVEAAINPRDWITIPTAMNVVDKLLGEEQRLLDDYEWIVIPVANPDGYEYTHTNERFWTKSRSTSSNLGFICPGVNINRNFDIDWGTSGSSSSPCSYLYAGDGPFSEIESQLIRSIAEEYNSRIQLYISLQNNGGIISYPWYYERAATALFIQHHLLGVEMVNALSGNYSTGVAAVALEPASGTSSDYFRNNGVRLTYNIDIVLSDDGSVVIPVADIEDIANDVWKAIVVAAEKVL